MHARSPEAGFTLAEITVVIVIVSVVAFVFTGMFLEAVRSYTFVDSEKGMLQEARYAEERISRELKRVRGNTFVTQATARSFTFVDRDSSVVGFSWTARTRSPSRSTVPKGPVWTYRRVPTVAA